jgi:hypothetical protein
MQKWEYMWMYVDDSGGKQAYVANGEHLPAQSNPEALNLLGRDGWELVSVIPPGAIKTARRAYLHFCLKRPLAD